MSTINSYSNVTPADGDKFLTTDVSDSNNTKNVLVSALKTFLHTAATFTGDFLVDVTTFFVDSTNNRVGVGTITPSKDLDVVGEGRFSTGVLFGSDTAAANTLDDYEEGTFTPTLSNIGTGTYTTQVGTYTKIGNIVTCSVNINLATIGSASGDLVVAGFPFTSNSTASAHFIPSSIFADNWTVGVDASLTGIISPSATIMTLKEASPSTGSLATPQHSDLGTGSVVFTLTYRTA